MFYFTGMQIRTFVISMENLNDRWSFMRQQLDNLWINYERFKATDPKQMKQEEIDEIYDEEKAKKIHPPKGISLWSLWCSYSHQRIYKKMVEEDIQMALVFEDDAIIDYRLNVLYKQIEWKLVWDIKRDYLLMNYGYFGWNYLCKHIKKIGRKYLRDGNLLFFLLYFCWWIVYSVLDFFPWLWAKITWKILIVRRYRPFYLAWWYFITKNWAKKLLSIHNKVFTVADFLPERYRKQSKLKIYVTVPLLVEQAVDKFPTTNPDGDK